jgi:hypothetical protein
MRCRRLVALLAPLAIASTLLLGSAALRPSSAQAWAWKDNCTLLAFNGSGSQSSVRPVFYLSVLPSPAGFAALGAFGIVGIPTTGAIAFPNTGYPVPSYGCHATVEFVNPGGNVSCAMSAPTTGANHFSCVGNARVKIIKDDDDIAGEVRIAGGARSSGSPPSSGQTRTGLAALRARALPGTGWRTSQKIDDLGEVGKLMKADSLPRSCQEGVGSHGVAATVVSSSELVRRGGSQGVGAIESSYGNAAQSERTLAGALSRHSIACLARLLTSKRLHTTVSTGLLATGGLGSNLSGWRLAVRWRALGVRRVDYLDVVGGVKGRRSALVMLESAGTPEPLIVGRDAMQAVLRRIGA